MESASGEVPSDPQLPTGRLRIPRCCLPPRLIQKRFISDISHVETETLNLILDPPPCDGALFFSPGAGTLIKTSHAPSHALPAPNPRVPGPPPS